MSPPAGVPPLLQLAAALGELRQRLPLHDRHTQRWRGRDIANTAGGGGLGSPYTALVAASSIEGQYSVVRSDSSGCAELGGSGSGRGCDMITPFIIINEQLNKQHYLYGIINKIEFSWSLCWKECYEIAIMITLNEYELD
ncbi:hypothetical protein ZEAMMB73_Zm00001d016268 [Zea mays]|uniref:Uncharacterized protein n=1 Tax=Zea mays TaxID=4577 RepID=A0A1D6H6G4_MAIZE|nr:hypothetical protein ZEAMMB73_Zm00001d016268 [Zea mays]